MRKFTALLFLVMSFFMFINTTRVYALTDSSFEEINDVELTEPIQLSNIVIFIRFHDEPTYNAPHPFSYYVNLFNGIDVVSLRDYYLEASYNQIEINSYFTSPTEIIYYTDSHDRSFYQPYDAISNPNGYDESERTEREHDLLKGALDYVEDNNLISDTINIDINQDDIVDSISFLVSGEDDGWNSLLWPHKWSLFTNYTDDPTINGKSIDAYTFELLGRNSHYDYAVDVSVLAHETFHLIGAPDLYHYYRYDWIQAIGYWGLMENLGDAPNHMLGYMKEAYGHWITDVDEIVESGTYTLYPLQDSPDNLYKYNTGFSNEYIYFEYRDNDGAYESNLPDTGLIVYRVDLDFYNQGNVDGYYNEYGSTEEEVFVFRPGIIYDNDIIEFAETDDTNMDEDGDIDEAALSNFNLYDSMGLNTDIPMFRSDGTFLDIQISNVIEHDGYITFDIMLPPSMNLVSDIEIPDMTDLLLVDIPGTYYEVTLNNIPEFADVYYTFDGSAPTTASTPYNGFNIPINSTNNDLNVAVYIDGSLYMNLSQTYTFVQTIETNHNPYGNMENITWLIHFEEESEVTLSFSSNFSMEIDYDYLYITNNSITDSYTGTDLSNEDLSFITNSILLNFVSDEYLDDFYGFACEVTSNQLKGIDLIGLEEISIDVFDEYIDDGYILNFDPELYYVTVSNPVDSNTVGDYEVTYSLFNNLNELISVFTRTVHVVDTSMPEVTLNGESELTLDVFSDYTDLGVTATDNYDTSPTLNISITGSINTSIIGTYVLTYFATDSSGNNSSTVIRTIHIVDTSAPVISFDGDIDITIEVFDDILSILTDNGNDMNQGAILTDNYDDAEVIILFITGIVDEDVLGDYVLTYTATDSSGNVSNEITRTIHVVDTQSPILTLNPSVDTLYIGDTYIEKSITYTDNYDDVLTVEITGVVTTNAVKTVEITYSVQDSSGNMSTIKRYITILEDEQIQFVCTSVQTTYEINKAYEISACRIDGTTVEANTSNVNSSVPGTYEISYEYVKNNVTYTYTTYIFFYDMGSIQPLAIIVRKEDL